MSIGGDLVGEVIALLQPLHEELDANVREYGGELDDITKDEFKLPTTLYTTSPGDEPASTVLAEFGGAEHEAQDGSNIAYLTTYKVNVWLVVGYYYSINHLEGGSPLVLDDGYALYDGVLDLVAGRRLLKDAETVRIVRGERLYFGMADAGTPWTDGDIAAVVFKQEFTVAANSIWQQFPGEAPIRAPG